MSPWIWALIWTLAGVLLGGILTMIIMCLRTPNITLKFNSSPNFYEANPNRKGNTLWCEIKSHVNPAWIERLGINRRALSSFMFCYVISEMSNPKRNIPWHTGNTSQIIVDKKPTGKIEPSFASYYIYILSIDEDGLKDHLDNNNGISLVPQCYLIEGTFVSGGIREKVKGKFIVDDKPPYITMVTKCQNEK